MVQLHNSWIKVQQIYNSEVANLDQCLTQYLETQAKGDMDYSDSLCSFVSTETFIKFSVIVLTQILNIVEPSIPIQPMDMCHNFDFSFNVNSFAI